MEPPLTGANVPGSARHSSPGVATPSWLPVLLGATVGALLCGGALAASALLAGHGPDPTPTARALCGDLTTRNYADLYTLLSSQQQASGTRAQFVASQRQLDVLRGPTMHCAYRLAGDKSGVTDLVLTLTRGAAPPATAHVRLILSGGIWRIDTFDSSLVRSVFITDVPG
jgi:hypothetical protein